MAQNPQSTQPKTLFSTAPLTCDFMYHFQRFNNPQLTEQDVTNDLEVELKFAMKDDDCSATTICSL